MPMPMRMRMANGVIALLLLAVGIATADCGYGPCDLLARSQSAKSAKRQRQ
jgi:hypothetical protein